MTSPRMTTCLWFNGQAEEAAQFYTSVFKDSKITHRQYYTEAGQEIHGQTPGTVMVVEFDLAGRPFVGLNGGPDFTFNQAISFMIDCEDQADVDYYWDKLSEGGDESRRVCGWLADRYGVSWQVVPKVLKQMMSDPDTEKAKRVTMAMMGMKKLDIAGLQKAFDG